MDAGLRSVRTEHREYRFTFRLAEWIEGRAALPTGRFVKQMLGEQIFAEFHSVGMKDIVSFPRILDQFDADGNFPLDRSGAAAAAKLMLDQLVWWADALRQAKARRPYRT